MSDRFFDVMNSNRKYDRKKLRCGLGIHAKEQIEALEQFYEEIRDLRVGKAKSAQPWQMGIMQSIRAVLTLYEDLKEQVEDFRFLLTRRCNQDVVENAFSRIRAMGGNFTQPGALSFERRLRLYILGKVK